MAKPLIPLANPSHEAIETVKKTAWNKTYLYYDGDLVTKRVHQETNVPYLAMWTDIEWNVDRVRTERWVLFELSDELIRQLEAHETDALTLIKQSTKVIVHDATYSEIETEMAESLTFAEYAAKYPQYQLELGVYLP